MPRRVVTPQGEVVWVTDDVNPGMGSLPYQALRRMVQEDARLPHAQNAGYVGPGIVNNNPVQGPFPGNDDPPPKHDYRPLNGAAQNNRGGTILLELPSSKTSTQYISLVETPKRSGDDAESLVVVCGTTILEPLSGPNSGFKVSGLLTFGIGGASFQAEFDWIQGVSFAVAASFARLAVRTDYVTNRNGKIALAGAFAYGPSPGGNFSPLRKTNELGTLTPGQVSVRQDIPHFSSGVTLLSEGDFDPSLRLRLYSGSRVSTFDMTSRANTSVQSDAQFALPGWAESFTVENTGIADIANVNAVFSLSL